MSEEVVTFGSSRRLVGILHRPEDRNEKKDLPAVLLLNAGILHRVGPNRLYVKIARQLEQLGFNVLRFDLWGIGDSQDHTGSGQSGNFFDDTLEAMDFLQLRMNVRKFMLMGICMGAKIALEVATRDSRVESLVLMEGIYIKSSRYHLSRILDPKKWKRILSGESHMVKQLRNRINQRFKGKGKTQRVPVNKSKPVLLLENAGQNMKRKLNSLLNSGVKTLLIFREGNEIAYNYRLQRNGDEIVGMGLPPGLDVAFVPFADHTFTPLLSQELLLKTSTRWIQQNHPVAVETPVSIAV
jgi:alpha/beta superfamily hydrolase